MPDVALISSLTYRPEELQRATYPDYPHFSIDEIPTMLRVSQRASTLHVHVLSLACVAETEEEFREFWRLLKLRKALLHSKEECLAILSTAASLDRILRVWRSARRNGAAKAGGEENARRAECEFWERFAKVKDRWHLTEKSETLLKEAGIKHHDTVRSYLNYTRWEWRRLTEPKRKRILEKQYGKR